MDSLYLLIPLSVLLVAIMALNYKCALMYSSLKTVAIAL